MLWFPFYFLLLDKKNIFRGRKLACSPHRLPHSVLRYAASSSSLFSLSSLPPPPSCQFFRYPSGNKILQINTQNQKNIEKNPKSQNHQQLSGSCLILHQLCGSRLRRHHHQQYPALPSRGEKTILQLVLEFEFDSL